MKGKQLAQSDPDFMQSLARGLDVLAAFATLCPPHTVTQIAKQTGLPRPVVRRCLHTLVRKGFVEEVEHRYEVLPRVLMLSGSYLAEKSLPVLAQPILDELRDSLKESCSLGVLDGEDVLYVARASVDRIINIALYVGSRLPAYCTSMGRVLLGALQIQQRDVILKRATLVQRTPRTVVNPRMLKSEIEQVAKRGYSLVEQELELGLRSIAVPVRNRFGRVIAAVNIGTSSARVQSRHMEARYLPQLLNAAMKIGGLVQ
jgi:IclR family transcriptional regulator, pca regulon regulatory protein